MKDERRRHRGVSGPDAGGDVDEELAFHIEMRAAELEAQGETPERARELALRRFGDYEQSRTECVTISERRGRRSSRLRYAGELRGDVAFAIRSLSRSPGFALVAIVTLALGVGANSAIFSVVNGVLLESLPYRDAAALHSVGMLYPDGTVYHSLSAPDFMSVREETRALERVEAYSSGIFTLLGAGEPREVRGG
jgi:putative ABC transport system permease protein